MSKNKEKNYVEIEDPLAGLGFDAEEAVEEAAEDEECTSVEEAVDEAEEEKEPAVPLSERIAAAKAKVSEKLKPVTDAATKKVNVKPAAVILGVVAVVAIVAAVLIFSLYSGATYTSGKSVADWAEEWNSISFTDSCEFSFYSTYEFTADMEAMLVSDTDHVYLTKSDIKDLKKGKTIKIFDDLAELSVETYKGDFYSATMTIDYYDMYRYYYGYDYVGNSYTYAPSLFEDSTMRVLGYMSMFLNPLNDNYNTESECLTAASDLFAANGSAYYDSNGNYVLVSGGYTYTLSYSYETKAKPAEAYAAEASPSDTSATDAADVSDTDVSATDVDEATEEHLIVTLTMTHNRSGEKKHAADWSWWSELFPEKEESNDISADLSEQEYDSELSASDAAKFSDTDMSDTDA